MIIKTTGEQGETNHRVFLPLWVWHVRSNGTGECGLVETLLLTCILLKVISNLSGLAMTQSLHTHFTLFFFKLKAKHTALFILITSH
jgi:hypothetical protein